MFHDGIKYKHSGDARVGEMELWKQLKKQNFGVTFLKRDFRHNSIASFKIKVTVKEQACRTCVVDNEFFPIQ